MALGGEALIVLGLIGVIVTAMSTFGTVPSNASAASWDLRVDPRFDPEQPTFKGGIPLSPEAHRLYRAILNYDPTRIENILVSSNSYSIGRYGLREVVGLLTAFRLTGDIRTLDELTRLSRIAHDSMYSTEWHPGARVTRAPHGERHWPFLYAEDYSDYGTDFHLSDTPRSLRVMAEVAAALKENRHLASPAGYDYEAEYLKWKEVLEGFVRVWSTEGDGMYPPSANVEGTYHGRYIPGGGGYV